MIKIKTKIPGPKSVKILAELKNKNGAWGVPYPFVHSDKGEGPYFQDIDGNWFLDFASQIGANPLGYNHPELINIIREYSNRFPIKFGGQDFSTEEHIRLITELTEIAPEEMNSAFLINSGAEAVENAMKICMRQRPGTKFGISMESGWHGRTLGALSLTNSKSVHKKGYMRLPMMRLPFAEDVAEHFERIIRSEADPSEIGFVIIECVQGEGGYNIAPQKLIKDLRSMTSGYEIPLIVDEVQAGMGRTGKWWAFQHYNITPDVFTSAKALQVGAVVSKKSMFPKQQGALSSTWGGGHILDMAIGMKTIEIIKREKLLKHNTRMGAYFLNRLKEINSISGQRGLGLMLAFDFSSQSMRDDVIIECIKNGLVLLGAGQKSIRIIPPYIIQENDIDTAINIIDKAIKTCKKKNFAHKGHICEFMHCGANIT